MKKGGIVLRTNLTVLAVSATMTLTAALIVSFGIPRVIGDHPIAKQWYLVPVYLAVGVMGILLYVAKSARKPAWLRRTVGLLCCSSLVLAAVVSIHYRVALTSAFLIPAFFACLYAIWQDEPSQEEATHDLVVLMAGAFGVAYAILAFLFGPGKQPILDLLALPIGVLSVVVIALHLAKSGSRADAAARTALGAAFIAAAVLAGYKEEPIFSLFLAPIGFALAGFPLLKHFRLGRNDDGLTEEGRVVRRFDRVAEIVVWSTYVFALIHLHFVPLGLNRTIFVLFISAFCIFSFEYEGFPLRKLTFQRFQRQTMTNTLLLAVIAHVTGGLQSPYAWFFIFILLSGAVTPDPGIILRRLLIIVGYYFIEIVYSASYGVLNTALMVEHLLPQLFVVGLTGLYTHQLSARRKEIDESLMATNKDLKATLMREQEGRRLVARQAKEIKLAQQRDEAIMASLADAVIVCDAAGKVTFLNLAAERYAGLSQTEAVGRLIKNVLPLRTGDNAPAGLEDLIVTVFKGNAVPVPEDAFIKREDVRIYVAGALVPIFGADDKVIAAVIAIRDVTYLREIDQMKTSFLSVAAHQLRTPLSTIRWYLELLNDPEEGKLKKNQKLFSENAYQSLRKMIGLVNRLLAVTRLEAGRVPIKPVPTDLAALTREILGDLELKLKERHLGVHVKADGKLPTVPLDATLAREAFTNLIENAVRYTREGGAIVIAIEDEGDAIHWSVKDTGIGIPPEQHEKIFEKFFRASNAVTHTAAGSGLGLYLAKFIVGTWKGRIWFESEEGKGTTFHVTVPKEGMAPKAGEVSLNA